MRPHTGPGADKDNYHILMEKTGKRIRTFFAGEVIADSTQVQILFESGHLPIYQFPIEDVRMDLLLKSKQEQNSKSSKEYFSIKVGDQQAQNSAWNYPHPIEEISELKNYISFKWNAMDAWFEEDEQVFVHARDPYHRVDILDSSRHIEVFINNVKVADSKRPRLLFETSLPTRFYLQQMDVKMELLHKSSTKTNCPHKGEASYWSVKIGSEIFKDIVWGYPIPTAESIKIAGLLSFYNEKVDIKVDGQLQSRPKTQFGSATAKSVYKKIVRD